MTNQKSSTDTNTQENTWLIGPRTLPPPDGASDFMRDAIAITPQPDPAAMQIEPQSEAEWLAVIAQLDEGKLDMAREISKQFSVSVEHDTIEGVNVYHVTPAEIDPMLDDKLFIHTHGGAFVLNGGEVCTLEAIVIAHLAKVRVLSIDYRMPPLHPAPTARDDVLTVYRHLLKTRPARSVAMVPISPWGWCST
jgi:monoterpene epsilon-lactone hydrolase